MNCYELQSSSSDEEKKSFSKAFLRLWNHEDNIKYLSFTGVLFKEEQINSWISELGPMNPIKYYYINERNDISAIIIINTDSVNGFEIFGLCVDSSSKSKGYGDFLIKKAIDIAVKSGHKAIWTSVLADNMRMQRLVLKNGFIPTTIDYSKRYDGMSLVKYLKKISNS